MCSDRSATHFASPGLRRTSTSTLLRSTTRRKLSTPCLLARWTMTGRRSAPWLVHSQQMRPPPLWCPCTSNGSCPSSLVAVARFRSCAARAPQFMRCRSGRCPRWWRWSSAVVACGTSGGLWRSARTSWEPRQPTQALALAVTPCGRRRSCWLICTQKRCTYPSAGGSSGTWPRNLWCKTRLSHTLARLRPARSRPMCFGRLSPCSQTAALPIVASCRRSAQSSWFVRSLRYCACHCRAPRPTRRRRNGRDSACRLSWCLQWRAGSARSASSTNQAWCTLSWSSSQ
mmetsp:Transcript_73836/g.210622  ORF Transcript_73836/g.210622 Transcript_73836/m.210622 type:complete len:286 (-) Transcript_73836:3305-4162(-)